MYATFSTTKLVNIPHPDLNYYLNRAPETSLLSQNKERSLI